MGEILPVPIHLFSFLDDLLAVTICSSAFLLGLLGGSGLIFLNLVVLVGLLDTHLAINARHTQTEIGIVKHVDG